jgi:hypothetical protein
LNWHGQENAEVRLTTSAGCRWTVRSAASWLTVAGSGERDGSDVVRFSCRYGMDQAPRTYGPAGDADEAVTVVMQQVSPSCNLPCPWSATTDVSWIRILSSMPRAGDDMFRYAVDPTATGATRTGRIRVANLVLVITQTP